MAAWPGPAPKAMFGYKQMSALADYIQAPALMLKYNDRMLA